MPPGLRRTADTCPFGRRIRAEADGEAADRTARCPHDPSTAGDSPGPTMGAAWEIVTRGEVCPVASSLTAARPSPRIDGVEPDASRGSMGTHGPQTLRGWTLGLALLATACASPSDADRPLYRWTDEAGVVRYTPDRSLIPRGARGDAEAVEAVRSVTPVESAESVESVESVELGATPTVDAPSDETHPSTPPAAPPSDLDARIRALEEVIARDEQALKALISAEGGGSLAESAELRQIARRLPYLQANLRALREERAAP